MKPLEKAPATTQTPNRINCAAERKPRNKSELHVWTHRSRTIAVETMGFLTLNPKPVNKHQHFRFPSFPNFRPTLPWTTRHWPCSNVVLEFVGPCPLQRFIIWYQNARRAGRYQTPLVGSWGVKENQPKRAHSPDGSFLQNVAGRDAHCLDTTSWKLRCLYKPIVGASFACRWKGATRPPTRTCEISKKS